MSKVFEIRIPANISSLNTFDTFNDLLFSFLCDLNKLSEVKSLDKEDIEVVKKGFNFFESLLKPYLNYDLYQAMLNNMNEDMKKAIDCFFKLKQEERRFLEEFNHD